MKVLKSLSFQYNLANQGDWPSWESIQAHETGHLGVSSGSLPLSQSEQDLVAKTNTAKITDSGYVDPLVGFVGKEGQENF